METLYIRYEGHKPFIQATVTDENDQVRIKLVDSSIANLIKEIKRMFRGYNLQVRIPGVTGD